MVQPVLSLFSSDLTNVSVSDATHARENLGNTLKNMLHCGTTPSVPREKSA